MINYDFAHQMNLAQNLQKSSHDFGDRAQKYYQEKQRQPMQLLLTLDQRIEASPYFLPTLLVFLVALLVYLRGRSLIAYVLARWSLRARRGGNLTASLASLEYREMLRLLEKHGWKKAESQTALEFAAAIPAADFRSVAQLTELYQSARFGDHPAPIEQMSSLLRSIRDTMRRGANRHPDELAPLGPALLRICCDRDNRFSIPRDPSERGLPQLRGPAPIFRRHRDNFLNVLSNILF